MAAACPGTSNETAVKVIDAPLLGQHWQMQEGLFDPQAERLLRSLAVPRRGSVQTSRCGYSLPSTFRPPPPSRPPCSGPQKATCCERTSFAISKPTKAFKHGAAGKCDGDYAVAVVGRRLLQGRVQDRAGSDRSARGRCGHVSPDAGPSQRNPRPKFPLRTMTLSSQRRRHVGKQGRGFAAAGLRAS